MKRTVKIAALALLAGALALSDREALAVTCCDGGIGKPAAYSLSSISMKRWIKLHRPDGEVVHIPTDQIVFVMSARNTGAHQRARARLQLVNGFADVLESVDEVMRAITEDNSSV